MESSSIHTRETNEETESVMRLVEISAGYWLPRVLHVVADLGVADALDEEPRSAGYLARQVGTDADALDRVLRLLASHGVFDRRGGMYVHNAFLGRCAATIRIQCAPTFGWWDFLFSGKAGERLSR